MPWSACGLEQNHVFHNNCKCKTVNEGTLNGSKPQQRRNGRAEKHTERTQAPVKQLYKWRRPSDAAWPFFGQCWFEKSLYSVLPARVWRSATFLIPMPMATHTITTHKPHSPHQPQRIRHRSMLVPLPTEQRLGCSSARSCAQPPSTWLQSWLL